MNGILSRIRSHALRITRPARSLLSSTGTPHGAAPTAANPLGQSVTVVIDLKALGTFLQVHFPTPRSLPLGHANIGMNDAKSIGIERTGRIAEFVAVEGGGAGSSHSGVGDWGSGSVIGNASGGGTGDDVGFDRIIVPWSFFGQGRSGRRNSMTAVSGSTSCRGRRCPCSGVMTRFPFGLMGFSTGGTAEAHAGYGYGWHVFLGRLGIGRWIAVAGRRFLGSGFRTRLGFAIIGFLP